MLWCWKRHTQLHCRGASSTNSTTNQKTLQGSIGKRTFKLIQVLRSVLSIRNFDIYEEIAAVCPEGRDIKTISNDEVDMRIVSKLSMSVKDDSSDGG